MHFIWSMRKILSAFKSIRFGLSILWIAGAFCVSMPALANDCSVYLKGQSTLPTPSLYTADFVVPNEPNPIDAKELVQAAGEGIYAVVGGERALFDYLMATDDKVKTLVALDFDPGIIHFHAMNNILLRIAPMGDTKTYQKLRFASVITDWKRLAQKAAVQGHISKDDFQLISKFENFTWWQKIMADGAWAEFKRKPKSPTDPFYGVNYIHDSSLLTRVQKLAQSGRYKAHLIDLGEATQVEAFVDWIRSTNFKLAFFDLSNAWQGEFPNDYLGNTKTAKLLESLNKVSVDSTIAMVTIGKSANEPMWFRGFRFSVFREKIKGYDAWTKSNYNWDYCAYFFQSAY